MNDAGPSDWEDGIALLGDVAFQLRRLLPDNDAAPLITRIENWRAQVQAQYLQLQAEAAAQAGGQ